MSWLLSIWDPFDVFKHGFLSFVCYRVQIITTLLTKNLIPELTTLTLSEHYEPSNSNYP